MGTTSLSAYSPTAIFTKQYRHQPDQPCKPGEGLRHADICLDRGWGASTYKLEVSQSPTFSQAYDSITTTNTRYTPTKVYESGKTYYWRVAAIIDKDGKVGPYNNATILSEAAPGGGVSRIEYSQNLYPSKPRRLDFPGSLADQLA